MAEVRAKWRPSMALVVGLVCLVLVSVPVLAFVALRLTSNHFVRETEQTLINQAAIYARVYLDLLTAQGAELEGPELDEEALEFWGKDLHPWQPVLNLRQVEFLPPLPDIDETGPQDIADPSAHYREIAPKLLALARDARKATLAGAIFLDQRGVDIRDDRRAGYGSAPEVQAALRGRVGSALRDRGGTFDRHPLASISRDTWYRVFVAYPVVYDDRIVGVVYLSRTPSNFAKFVQAERSALLIMLGATLLAAAVVGWLLFRLFTGPLRALNDQTTQIALGQLSHPAPLAHYGVHELATLGQSVIRMAKSLSDRSRQTAVYTDHVTHELKSPVTAILGAAELLGSDEITPEARNRLHHTIERQAIRMNDLLEKLREMTRLRGAPTTGSGPLAEMLPDVPGLSIEVTDDSVGELPMLLEHGRVLFQQLARNAAENGASVVKIRFQNARLTVRDNGAGIPTEYAEAVLNPFFTTRRDEGGTGLGLAIVVALLQNYDGVVRVEPCETGACVVVQFPQAGP